MGLELEFFKLIVKIWMFPLWRFLLHVRIDADFDQATSFFVFKETDSLVRLTPVPFLTSYLSLSLFYFGSPPPPCPLLVPIFMWR